jgi:hypothetical protein
MYAETLMLPPELMEKARQAALAKKKKAKAPAGKKKAAPKKRGAR